MKEEVTGLLLAAGESRRFGADKLMHGFARGEPMALVAARRLVAALPRTVVVVSRRDSELTNLLQEIGLRTVVNPRATAGIGSSIACGVQASEASIGWVIALADMPFIAPETISRVAAGLISDEAICAPVYDGRRGHPVGFGRAYGSVLQRLNADRGARCVIRTHSDRLRLIRVEDAGVIRDIDRPSDLSDMDKVGVKRPSDRAGK